MPQIALNALPEVFRTLKELNLAKLTINLPHDFLDRWDEIDPVFLNSLGEELHLEGVELNHLLVDIISLYKHPKTELVEGRSTGYGWCTPFKIKISSANLGSLSLYDYSVTYTIYQKRKPVSITFGMHSQIDEYMDLDSPIQTPEVFRLQAH